jgi:hypothetical protein
VQCETISLTRGLPALVGWAMRPFLTAVPRESLEFMLVRTAAALRRP